MQYKHSFTLTDNVFYKLKVCGNILLTDDGWKFFQVKFFFFFFTKLCANFRHSTIAHLLDYNVV